jgi:hypothetical protein
MIGLQSQLTGVAESPSANQRSTAGIPSPGGEGQGEGELNPRGRQSALIRVLVPATSVPASWRFKRVPFKACHVPRGFPSLFKAIKGYPNLFKGFWKKYF